jgi:hypothetical protein
MNQLWTPGHVAPTKRKTDGGSHFDDELETTSHREKTIQSEYDTMVEHLNQRPDHKVYVGSSEERAKMREVFNHMFAHKVILRHPDIRIEYGVADGAIRIAP